MHRHAFAGMAFALFVAGCADRRPTAPASADTRTAPNDNRSAARHVDLTGPVSGTLADPTGTPVGSLAGPATILGFSIDGSHRLVANGTISGTATVNGATVSVLNRPFSALVVLPGATTGDADDEDEQAREASLTARAALISFAAFHISPTAAQQGMGSCHIASIGLAAIPIDILGLNLTLSLVSIDIGGTTGPDRTLGNLLCTLIRLLNVGAATPAITNVLSRINALLGGVQA